MGTTEPTLTDLMTTMKQNTEKLTENTNAVNSFMEWIKGLENRVTDVETRVSTLEKKTDENCSKDELMKAVKDLKDDFAEQQKRASKRNNAIVFGIPESDAGQQLLQNLLNVLIPGESHKMNSERLGDPEKPRKNPDQPRPLRLFLSNYALKRKLFSNLKNLKGLDEFKRVSVDKDLTKAEQLARPSRPVTRSQSALNAEKAAQTGIYSSGKPPPSKRPRKESNNQPVVIKDLQPAVSKEPQTSGTNDPLPSEDNINLQMEHD